MCEKTVRGHVLQAKNLTQGELWEERTWGLSPNTAREPSLHSPRVPIENHTHTSHTFPTTSLKPNPTQAPPLPEGPVGSRPPQTEPPEPPSISGAVYTTSSWVGLSAAQKDELFHDVLFPNDATGSLSTPHVLFLSVSSFLMQELGRWFTYISRFKRSLCFEEI